MLRLPRVSRRRRETPRAQHPLAGGPRALRAALEPPGAVEDSLDPHRRPILRARHSMERPRGRAFHNLCRCAEPLPRTKVLLLTLLAATVALVGARVTQAADPAL